MSSVDRRHTWRHHAACKRAEASIFFSDNDADAALAVRICHSCPVRIPCLEHALDTDQRYGVWGGTRPIHRDRLRAVLPIGETPDLDDADFWLDRP